MAHYAFLDQNNIVTEVITGKDENELLEGLTPEEWYENYRGQRCIRTSYNGKIRKNYAAIGYTYDSERDAFIPPMPPTTVPGPEIDGGTVEVTWTLNEDTCNWEMVPE